MVAGQRALTRSDISRPTLPVTLSGHILCQLCVRVELSAVDDEGLVLDQEIHD
jgi:hypothetical protein